MALEDSILKSTKKKLNIGTDDPSFDIDIIDHINAAFSHLQQLGVGPEAGFQIEDDQATWSQFVADAPLYIINAVKTNIYLRVRSVFDPPTMPHVMTALMEQLTESDVRLSMMREATGWVNPDPPPSIVEELQNG